MWIECRMEYVWCEVTGVTDGVYLGKRYFMCPTEHGVLVKVTDVESTPAVPRKPPITGNPMFPSYEEIQARRKILAKTFFLHLSFYFLFSCFYFLFSCFYFLFSWILVLSSELKGCVTVRYQTVPSDGSISLYSLVFLQATRIWLSQIRW